ncbi:MAG: hypothetical protein J5775_01185 [Spirochaetales bacterium]|nr:hypothetical protein [Spirochaetales bacterium]
MKKTCLAILLVALCLILASCATKAKDSAIHVTTFDEFTAAFAAAQADPEKDTILLENDITWDLTKFNAEINFMPNATGLVIDLGGHTISEVPKNAFNLTGDSFILQNGTILGDAQNSRYSVNVNYEGTNGLKDQALAHVPAAYDDADPVWAKRVIVRNIKATGMLCGYSTMEVVDCEFTGGQYRGLVFQGSSGIVQNVKAITLEEGASAGFVAHSYGTVLVKGECEFKGKFGVYSAQCSTLSFDEAANVKIGAWVTYGIYLEKQGFTTIGKGVTVQPAEGRQTFYMRTGSTLVIEKGAVVLDGTGAEVAAPITADNIDYKDGAGASDDAWKGAGVNAVWTDNR